MAKYNKGDSVTFVETNESGVIVEVYAPYKGKQQYAVRWINSGDISDILESRLEPERKLENAFDMLQAGIYSAFVDFARLNTQYKIENTSINTISSLKASRTIFKPYQYKPLLKFLNSDSRRILIADEVGLGKTIEAGHIMLELKARNELGSAIIVCPSSLQDKWKDELETRFDLRFKKYEHKLDFIADIESHRPIYGILTYEKIRTSSHNDLGEILEEKQVFIDLVVCDEAHRMRNSGTDTFDGAKKFLTAARSAIFMSATPIMLHEGNLFTLLNLLDPYQFKSEEVFRNLMNANKPFVAAISELNAKLPFKDIAQRLMDAELRYEYKYSGDDKYKWTAISVKEDYKSNPLFNKIIADLNQLEETDHNRVKIQYDISSISILNNIFSRTTKRDVTTDWSQAIRMPNTITIKLTEFERNLYDDYLENKCAEEGVTIYDANPLFLSSLKKTLASSVIANTTEWENKTDLPYDSKFEALKEIIDDVLKKQGKKLIVFATTIRTLKYLQYRLMLEGVESLMIYGGIKERQQIVCRFQMNKDFNILLSSEVGGEGLDMQFCDTIVNYDLPWNPMVVEQRIGRIDRFGQTSEYVYIYNILVKGTLQEKIYGRLLNRIGIFRECIGDIEVILDRFLEKENIKGVDFVSYLEREVDNPNLTEDEVNRKLDSIRKAIEQVKFDVDQLTKGLSDSLTNDMYFKEEINKINNHNRYITETELINYVNSIIANKLKTVRLKKIDKFVYNIALQKGDAKALTNFLITNKPNKTDINYSEFLNYIRDEYIIPITFNQEYAYENKGIQYVNSYHPLTMAITEYYKKEKKASGNTFRMVLRKADVDNRLKTGVYIMGVYLLDIQREVFHSVKHTQLLIPIVFDCQNEDFVDDEELNEKIFSASQVFSEIEDEIGPIDVSFPLQMAFSEKISEVQDRYKEDYNIRSESNKIVLRQRIVSQYEKRIQSHYDRIDEYQYSYDPNKLKLIPALKGKVKKWEEELQTELMELDRSKIAVNPNKLVSLSVITIK